MSERFYVTLTILTMTYEAKLMCGIILLTIPGIQYGGFFLLRLLSGGHKNLALNDLQKSMFRAGHAHAGVLVILSLICQPLVDGARSRPLLVGLFAPLFQQRHCSLAEDSFFPRWGKR